MKKLLPKAQRGKVLEILPKITRTVSLDEKKIFLSLPSHTTKNPRQLVLVPKGPKGSNKFEVHIKTWDGEKKPATDMTPQEKEALFESLYNELPQGAEILFPLSDPDYLATRGTVAGLKRLGRDSRFSQGTKGILYYTDKDGKTIKTFEGTSFIKK